MQEPSRRQTGGAGREPTRLDPAGWARLHSALSGLEGLTAMPRNLPETHPGPPAHAGAMHHPEEAVLGTQGHPSNSTVPSGVLTDGHNVYEDTEFSCVTGGSGIRLVGQET